MSTPIPAALAALALASACGSPELQAGFSERPSAPPGPSASSAVLGPGTGADEGDTLPAGTGTEALDAGLATAALEAVKTEPDGKSAQDPEPEAAPAFDQEHASWTALLGAHVRAGRVDYGAWKKSAEDRAALAAYLEALDAVAPEVLEAWSEAERLAFWINAYNASVVDLVVANYPLKSIEGLSTKKLAVWDKPLGRLGAHLEDRGAGLSLNDMEHAIVRERFEDARIHAALNCAAESCPPMLAEAFRAEELDEQLEARMRYFVADSTRNTFDAEEKRLELSRLFEWFAADFERDAGSVRAYVQRYAPFEDARWIAKAEIDYLDYSWKLNDVQR